MAQSTDLNPIERLWALLDREIGERSLTKKDDLKKFVLDAWGKIDKKKNSKISRINALSAK